MFISVILLGFMALAFAAPQYGYQQHESLVSSPSAAYGGFQSDSVLNVQSVFQGHGGEKYLPPVPTTVVPIVRKQFYVVSAPEDEDSQQRNKHLIFGRPQTNYRVVFIKAPSSGSGNVKYSAEFAPQEEKTVIYVLSKKDRELDANDIATPAPTVASKPEVFFIKYKTDEEAQHAQEEIQGEYDKLGGINEVADETTASITSVVGSLENLNSDGSYNYRTPNGIHHGKKKHSTHQSSGYQHLSSPFKH